MTAEVRSHRDRVGRETLVRRQEPFDEIGFCFGNHGEIVDCLTTDCSHCTNVTEEIVFSSCIAAFIHIEPRGCIGHHPYHKLELCKGLLSPKHSGALPQDSDSGSGP